MKIIYRKNSFLLPPKGYTATNVFGIVLFVNESAKPISERLWNHERIHSRQYREMLFVGFLIWYALERLIRLILYVVKNRKYLTKERFKIIAKKSYHNISFEREAYTNENNLNYLNTRKWYSWIKYLTKKNNVRSIIDIN